MKKKIIRIVLCAVFLVGGALALLLLTRPSIRQYQKRFGFSLEGLNVHIIRREHIDAFQDPGTGYAVTLTNGVQDSDFAPDRMTKGLTEAAKQAAEHFNSDLKAEGKAPLMTLKENGEYYCRRFSSKNDNSTFTVIYDSTDGIWYMYWEG